MSDKKSTGEIYAWRSAGIGKYPAMTLPELVFCDPAEFFRLVTIGAFVKTPNREQAAAVNRRATHIKISPGPYGERRVALYYCDPFKHAVGIYLSGTEPKPRIPGIIAVLDVIDLSRGFFYRPRSISGPYREAQSGENRCDPRMCYDFPSKQL